ELADSVRRDDAAQWAHVGVSQVTNQGVGALLAQTLVEFLPAFRRGVAGDLDDVGFFTLGLNGYLVEARHCFGREFEAAGGEIDGDAVFRLIFVEAGNDAVNSLVGRSAGGDGLISRLLSGLRAAAGRVGDGGKFFELA